MQTTMIPIHQRVAKPTVAMNARPSGGLTRAQIFMELIEAMPDEKPALPLDVPEVMGEQINDDAIDQDYMDQTMGSPAACMTKLTLEDADKIVNNAIACGKRNGFNPFAVSVIDAAGNTICHKVMDGCSMVGIPEFATAKAYSCIVTKLSSRDFRDKYTADGDPGRFCQMTSMVGITGDKMMPCPGGTLIKNQNGDILGAVGVSGASADEDEYCGMVGVLETNPLLDILPKKDSCTTKKDKVGIFEGKQQAPASKPKGRTSVVQMMAAAEDDAATEVDHQLKSIETTEEFLTANNIEFKTLRHEVTMTNEAMKEIVKFEGEHAGANLGKNLFLYDRKKKDKFWLVCAEVDTDVDLKALNKHLPVASGKLTWVNEDQVMELLGCAKGNVNFFSIVNDVDKKVKVLYDKKLYGCKYQAFHPMDNAASTAITAEGVDKIKELTGRGDDDFEIFDFEALAAARAEANKK